MTPAEALALAARLRDLPPEADIYVVEILDSARGREVLVQLRAPLGPTEVSDDVAPGVGTTGAYLRVKRMVYPGFYAWWTVPAEIRAVTP